MHVMVLVLTEAEDEVEAQVVAEENCYSAGGQVFDYVSDDLNRVEPGISKKDGTSAYICNLKDYHDMDIVPYYIVSGSYHIDCCEYFTEDEWDNLIATYIKEFSEKESNYEKWLVIKDAHI